VQALPSSGPIRCLVRPVQHLRNHPQHVTHVHLREHLWLCGLYADDERAYDKLCAICVPLPAWIK
jgi:hypothetical protein